MGKLAIIGIIIVAIIILGSILYLFKNKNGIGSIISSVVTTTKTNTTKNNTVSSVITVTTTQENNTTGNSTILADCLTNLPNESIPNGNFQTGSYQNWNVTGIGFGSAPANIIQYNNESEYYNSPWENYNGQYFATTYRGGFIISPGNITSDAFQVTEPYLNFKIVSPQNNLLYVEILENNTPVIVKQFNSYGNIGAPSGTFENATIPLTSLLCKNINIRVVSGVVYTPATKYDIIAVGDFYLSKTPIGSTGTSLN
ncbi:MAG: hypothetical protein QXD23_00050 [Candidatus Micrarchaeaceae archaeon]